MRLHVAAVRAAARARGAAALRAAGLGRGLVLCERAVGAARGASLVFAAAERARAVRARLVPGAALGRVRRAEVERADAALDAHEPRRRPRGRRTRRAARETLRTAHARRHVCFFLCATGG